MSRDLDGKWVRKDLDGKWVSRILEQLDVM